MEKQITVDIRELTALDFVQTFQSMRSMGQGEIYEQALVAFKSRTSRHEFLPLIAAISLHDRKNGNIFVGVKKDSMFMCELYLLEKNPYNVPKGAYRLYHKQFNDHSHIDGVVIFKMVKAQK